MVTDLDKKLFHLQTARCCIGRFRCHILHSHDTGTFHRTALKDELNANKVKANAFNLKEELCKLNNILCHNGVPLHWLTPSPEYPSLQTH